MTSTFLLSGMRAFAGLVPIFLLFTVACGRVEPPNQTHSLDAYGLQIETPSGWTGGGAGGTYEFHSPDGLSRLRVSRLEGTAPGASLKDAHLMTGTGAAALSSLLPTSPTKVGNLHAMRARFSASDGRVYDIVAVQLPTSMVLVQTSVTAEYAAENNVAVEKLFALVRQSLRYPGPASGAQSSSMPLASRTALTHLARSPARALTPLSPSLLP